MSFFEELKRRNVVRVGIAYGIAAWVLLQVADLVLENIEAPPWVIQALMLVVALGFIAAVVIAWAYELTPEGIKKESEIDRSQSIVGDTGRKLDRIIIGFLVLAVAYFIYERQSFQDRNISQEEVAGSTSLTEPGPNAGDESQVQAEPSIAVLPFADLSPDKDQEYFSDGIAEELLNLLVRVDGLKVASRTSSFTYKGSSLNLADIASELKVDHVLEGSVRKADNRVRITAQLIDADTDRHLWSDTYDRELDDIFAIQDDIANAIVDALRQELGIAGEGKAVTVEAATQNLDAYQLFLQGRSLFVARLDLPRAVALLERAVELDPEFDRAWAELAATYSVMESWGYQDKDYSSLSIEAADRALELNPGLSTPWAVKGQANINEGRPLVGTEQLNRAIELDPDNATHYLWRGIQLSAMGYQQDAASDFERCLEIDPAYENCRRHLAITHAIMGDNAKMLTLYQQGIEAGFRASSGALVQRFISLDQRLAAAQALLAGEETVSELPVKAVLDAMEFPNRDHTRGLARFEAWLENAGQQGRGFNAEIFSVFKAYDKVAPDSFSNRWVWLSENQGFRQSPYFRSYIEELGYPEYWRQHGFPPSCQPLGDDDFECE